MVEEKYQHTSQKESHDTLLSNAVDEDTEEQTRLREMTTDKLNIQRSS